MANREELGIIRGARAGDAECQLALGKLYLFGGASLPKSQPTALHWLNRAALQGQAEAGRLIGRHIGFEHAQYCREAVLPWYERAWEEGSGGAGLVLAQLVLSAPDAAHGPLRMKALLALDAAVRAGLPDAAWLQSQQRQAAAAEPDAAARTECAPAERAWPSGVDCAAAELQYGPLEQLWHSQPRQVFLARALPLARTLLLDAPPDAETARGSGWQIAPRQVLLLARCAQALADEDGGREGGEPESGARPAPSLQRSELQRFRELAAHGGDRSAQLALGLWFARMNCVGDRVDSGIASVNFKRAIRWLTQAGEQGLADAWFALSRIYIKPEFSQRSVSEAQACLERAADMGHSAAQLECGIHAWRTRRGDEHNDVRAAYWLQKAAAQGSAEAESALARIAPPAEGAAWADALQPLLTRELLSSQPLLAARMELAWLFKLTRAEALLLDVKAADQGHCLVLDIRASYGRSKRRLVLVRTGQQRQALDRIARLFEQVDCSLAGPEGNYRQRLYRFKTWLPQGADMDRLLAA